MQFYKHRPFGELISDTFDFVRAYGKNYFKNFFIVNGAILILLLIVVVLGYGELFQQAFSSNIDGSQFYFEQYFSQNDEVFIIVTALTVILFIILLLVSYSFPVLYMKRKAEHPSETITSTQMVDDLKSVWRKMLIFGAGLFLIITPISILLIVLSGVLMFILIGFILFLFLIPALMNIINFTLFEYYHTNKGFFSAVNFAFRTQFSNNFFKYWGSTTLMYMIIQVVTSIFTMIPSMVYLGGVMIVPESGNLEEDMIMMSFTFLIYAISIVVSFVISNLLYINSGLMYYDAKKEFHKDVQLSEIESLGQREV